MTRGNKMRPKVRAIYDTLSPRIGFELWNLDCVDKMHEMLAMMMEEGLAIATKEYECGIEFAVPTDRPRRKRNPTSLNISLPIGPEECVEPVWTIDLYDVVRDAICLYEHGIGGPINDDEDRVVLEAIRDDLTRFAAKIDDALNRKRSIDP